MSCTCKIQWVDGKGQPTPDTNDAVMLAHFHKPIRETYTGKLLHYTEQIQDSFPICAEHYAKVTPEMLYPTGGWSFTAIA